jgi:hypothetical protein
MEVVDETTAFEVDREWIESHIDTLTENYADHWVAVKGGRVIALEVDLGELLNKLPDIAHTCIEYIDGQRTVATV